MGNVLFSRTAQSLEQQLLLVALEGDVAAFAELVTTKNVDPKKIEIFDASNDGWGFTTEKHYLLFELAKRGNVELFKTLILEHGFCLTIFEDEVARGRESLEKSKELDAKLGLPIIRDDSTLWHVTRSAYYFPLPRFLDDTIKECREKLRELMGMWLRVNAEYQKLDAVDGVSIDADAFEKYSALHAKWAGSVWSLSFGFSAERRADEARKHQRSRPRVNPLFEKVKRRRALRAGMDEHKKTYTELMLKYRDLLDIRDFSIFVSTSPHVRLPN